MSRFARWFSWLTLTDMQPDVVRAQMREQRRYVPLFHALVATNVATLAYTHSGLTPRWLAFHVPGILISFCFLRMLFWLSRPARIADVREATTHLRRSIVVGVCFSTALSVWGLSLAGYGGHYEQAHVMLFVALTLTGSIFCLMRLPQAALLVTLIMAIPYVVYCMSGSNRVFTMAALNIACASVLMAKVLLNNFDAFTQLVRARAETERLGAENLRLACTDTLTGLPNRHFFFAEVAKRIEKAHGDGSTLVVGLVDIDSFRSVNDAYGHATGDRLLQEVGRRLGEMQMTDFLVARLGGDEFGFVMPKAAGMDAEVATRTICELVAETYRLDELSISVGCSAGIATYPYAGSTPHELFDHADYALHNSKQSGRNGVTRYSVEHETRIRAEQAVEAALQSADLEAELELHLQPIASVEERRVTSVEALARWTSPSVGPVRPDIFIPLAERMGLIRSVTVVLFRKSLSALARLPPDVGLSFNLSAFDVTSPQTMLTLVKLVRESAVDPTRLTFELTETAVMRDFDVAQRSVGLLRALGAKIALDDFGTGYSSLSYLHRLTIDRIKIDRSFVQAAVEPNGRSLLASIMALVHTMGLDSVAEGVEEESQLAVVRSLGCHAFQGYLFARPMPADEAVALIGSARPAAGRVA